MLSLEGEGKQTNGKLNLFVIILERCLHDNLEKTGGNVITGKFLAQNNVKGSQLESSDQQTRRLKSNYSLGQPGFCVNKGLAFIS